MADRTFDQLVTEALHDDFDPTKYSTKAGEAINDALQDIARRARLPTGQATATITTAAGTTAYTLPTDLLYITSVVDITTGRSLDEVATLEDYDELVPAGTTPAQSIASSFYVYGSQLMLYPAPGDARSLYVRYQKALGDTSGSTAISSFIPDDYAYLLVAYARARMFAFEDDPQMSDYWQGKYETGLAKLRSDSNSRIRRLRRVGDRRSAQSWPVFRRP